MPRLSSIALLTASLVLAADLASAAEPARKEKGWLGVALVQAPAPEAMGKPAGTKVVVIRRALPGSAALKAGVEAGDVAVAIDGKPVANVKDMVARVGQHAVGDTLKLRLFRDGKERALTITLGARPDPQAAIEAHWIGREMPGDFAFRDAATGAELKLADLRGGPLVFEYWATTCGPCKRAAPELDRLKERYAKHGVEVLSVSDEEPDIVKAFLERLETPYRHRVATDPRGIVDRELMLYSMPVFFYLDAKGIVRAVAFGFRDAATLERDLKTTLPGRGGVEDSDDDDQQ